MAVFPPTAASGNSRCLATFGPSGEIQGFFYPRIDFARNVNQAMFAVYMEGGQPQPLAWSFAEWWKRGQHFEQRSNVLTTTLRHARHDLSVEVTDVVPPGETALLRRFRIGRGPGCPRVRLFHYFDLIPNDTEWRNAVQSEAVSRVVVQHFREVSLGVAAERPFAAGCGVVRAGQSDVKSAMERGGVIDSHQAIGNVDFCIAFDVPEEREWSCVLVLAGGATRSGVQSAARRLADAPFEDALRDCRERCGQLLDSFPPCETAEFAGAYERAVISLFDLYDDSAGVFIAAPAFDPGFVRSGGYGFCWPRDTAVCAVAAARAGRIDIAEQFFAWMARTQLADGHWYQRYWTDGSPAPSWCVREDEIQLDQTCSLVHAAGRLVRLAGRDADVLRAIARGPVERAVAAIVRHIGPDHLHRCAMDLWECCKGTFAYTNGAVIAALREAHEVFGVAIPDLAPLRRALFARFWSAEKRRWARRITPEGELDETLDSSMLGLIRPWGVLDLTDAREREIARETIETVAERLSVPTRGGPAILRFERETYMGGGPGCVNTLWLGLCRLRLAAATPERREAQEQTAAAMANMRAAIANASPTGQLPELIPAVEFDYWAAPHAWASALLIECVLSLQELRGHGIAVASA